jgi:transcriptional regulator with XRE-family HTH domain
MPDEFSRRRRRKYTQHRSENMAMWVNEPLQNLIRDELARRDQTISDLARTIGSQPSLVSRWMQGQRPNTESLALIADALGIDVLRLLKLAGHIPPGVLDEGEDSPETANLVAMIRQAGRDGYITTERCLMLFTLIEFIRTTPPGEKAATSQNPGASNGHHQEHPAGMEAMAVG